MKYDTLAMTQVLRTFTLLIVLLASNAVSAGLPNTELMCHAPEPELDRFRFLRSAALDITGTSPPIEWYEALKELDEVPEEWIDEMLWSPEFADRVVRWHQALVWNNLSLVRLFATRIVMRKTGDLYYVSGTRATIYRGLNTVCNNSPAIINPDGTIATGADGLEGYVWVEPHWLPPGEAVKVCAFDAQEAEVSPDGADCSSDEGLGDPACGCGPNLIYCGPRTVETWIQESFAEDLNRRVHRIIEQDLPYTELFTSTKAFVNGPIVHYWKSFARFPGGVRNTPVPVQLESLPDLETWQRGEDDWIEIDLPKGHAGILTSPAWLLRFQTNRGRASQFYSQFLCSSFKAEGTLPTADPAIQAEPDLQEKAGCNICHAVLEPSAAYWGRWTEAGAGYLDPLNYPPLDAECYTCATTGLTCSADCSRYYKVKAYHPKEEAYLGMLRWYVFQHEDNEKNVEEGPELMALLEVARNRLPDCAARTAVRRFLGRDVLAEEEDWIDELVVTFAGTGFSYRELVKAVIMSPIYRRML